MTEAEHETPRTRAGFADYVGALEEAGAPLLGHLVFYSVFSGEVTPALCRQWFRELGLDLARCPEASRPCDVFERVTGPAGVRRKYSLGERQTRKQRRALGSKQREAVLMIRHVGRRDGAIARRLVREVRDEERVALDYEAGLALIEFSPDGSPGSDPGAGALRIAPNRDAIAALPQAEQAKVQGALAEVRDSFERGRLYLSGDKLRAVVRDYIESFSPIIMRPTGGVYFVAAQHAQTLGALRELVGRFGHGSNLNRVPIADQDEMREMVIAAFIARADTELQKLADQIARAQQSGATTAVVEALWERFSELQKAAAEHEAVLSGALGDTEASMRMVELQLTGLLMSAGTGQEGR
jgi:hypothetical protein